MVIVWRIAPVNTGNIADIYLFIHSFIKSLRDFYDEDSLWRQTLVAAWQRISSTRRLVQISVDAKGRGTYSYHRALKG
jgi:hypothetical protein